MTPEQTDIPSGLTIQAMDLLKRAYDFGAAEWHERGYKQGRADEATQQRLSRLPAVAAEPNCNHEWRPAAIYGGRRIEWCAHCDALRWVVLEAPAVAAEPSDAATLAIKALEAAKNGLEWYRDARPMLTDGSDDETDAQIDAAILALRQGTHASVPAVTTAPTSGESGK